MATPDATPGAKRKRSGFYGSSTPSSSWSSDVPPHANSSPGGTPPKRSKTAQGEKKKTDAANKERWQRDWRCWCEVHRWTPRNDRSYRQTPGEQEMYRAKALAYFRFEDWEIDTQPYYDTPTGGRSYVYMKLRTLAFRKFAILAGVHESVDQELLEEGKRLYQQYYKERAKRTGQARKPPDFYYVPPRSPSPPFWHFDFDPPPKPPPKPKQRPQPKPRPRAQKRAPPPRPPPCAPPREPPPRPPPPPPSKQRLAPPPRLVPTAVSPEERFVNDAKALAGSSLRKLAVVLAAHFPPSLLSNAPRTLPASLPTDDTKLRRVLLMYYHPDKHPPVNSIGNRVATILTQHIVATA